MIGVPEHSHPGESQSNGAAEAAVKALVAQARTLKAALEGNLKLATPIPCGHPVVHWLFEHADWVLSKFVVDGEGRTPYGRLHGTESRERICEFGERIMFYLPKSNVRKWMFVGSMASLSEGSWTPTKTSSH